MKNTNCRALHIDYTPFLGCLESFYDKPGKQNQEKNYTELKKKKKKLNHIDCKIAYESMTI